jgi:hypothetical protein
MAYQFASASSQHLIIASAPVTTAPITMACWHNNVAGGADGALMTLNSSGSDQIRLARRTDNGINASTIATTSATAIAAPGTAGVWQHAAGTFETSRRQAFLNGAGGTAETTSLAPVGISEILIGTRRISGALGLYYNGGIAEAAIWNAILTDAEILSLARGFTPDQVRPQSLVFYAPLIRTIQDIRGGLAITATNSPTVAVHPRVVQ